MTFRVDVVHVGPQKSATTWLYKALHEHPEVALAETDEVHYFDIHYARGLKWYARQFSISDGAKKTIDFTSSYIRSPLAAARMSQDFPEIKIILCVRDPIERAFSHYWHDKKKRRFDYTFDEATKNYDLFQNWIEPGFYAVHIKRLMDFFPRQNILIQRFEHLSCDAKAFLREACDFCDISIEFEPSVLNRKVNAARAAGKSPRRIATVLDKVGLLDTAKQIHGKVMSVASSRPAFENLSDIDEDFLKYLTEVYRDDMLETERLIAQDK